MQTDWFLIGIYVEIAIPFIIGLVVIAMFAYEIHKENKAKTRLKEQVRLRTEIIQTERASRRKEQELLEQEQRKIRRLEFRRRIDEELALRNRKLELVPKD